MNAQTNSGLIPPIYDTLMGLKSEIFKSLRCCLVGSITKVNTAGTVDVQVGWMQTFSDGTSAQYPELQGCPLITIHGGNVSLTTPVKVGDECLVFIGDRCIDAWLTTGAPQPIPNMRMHDISDGFVLVGVNSLVHPLNSCMLTGEGGIGTNSGASPFAKVAVNGTLNKITVANTTQNLLVILTSVLTPLSVDPALSPASKAAALAAIASLNLLLY